MDGARDQDPFARDRRLRREIAQRLAALNERLEHIKHLLGENQRHRLMPEVDRLRRRADQAGGAVAFAGLGDARFPPASSFRQDRLRQLEEMDRALLASLQSLEALVEVLAKAFPDDRRLAEATRAIEPVLAEFIRQAARRESYLAEQP